MAKKSFITIESDTQQNDFHLLPTNKISARILNSVFFFTGKKCKNNHIDVRYTSSGNCRKCIEEKRNQVILNFRNRSTKRKIDDQILAEKAINLGMTTYISTTSCKLGHFERFCTNNNCKICSDIQNKNRKNKLRWGRILKEYSLTETDYKKIIKKQEYKCAICFQKINEKNTHVDHCHKTMRVRGLLCSKCNQGIGLLNDDINILKSAIEYLS